MHCVWDMLSGSRASICTYAYGSFVSSIVRWFVCSIVCTSSLTCSSPSLSPSFSSSFCPSLPYRRLFSGSTSHGQVDASPNYIAILFSMVSQDFFMSGRSFSFSFFSFLLWFAVVRDPIGCVILWIKMQAYFWVRVKFSLTPIDTPAKTSVCYVTTLLFVRNSCYIQSFTWMVLQ